MTRRIAHVAQIGAVVLALVLVPVALAGKGQGGQGGSTSSGCSISPGQVALDQVWTVSAWGLPSTTVNMILTFPNGAQSVGPVTVGSNGTFTTTGNSNMSASWGFITPEQRGTYTYQFVGKIRWPYGTYTKSYGTCAVVVS
ncbi:MAG TPA: hypothetical protein VE688_00595 [Gaiellaceae bacterium]|jgi:hypothetical protein|nr:hypothetical protein [Gaiellaceae bacterium]